MSVVNAEQILTVADPTVGTVLLASGAVAWRLQAKTRTGAILAATGIFWFVGSVFGAAVFLHRGPLVQLHLSYPTGRRRRAVAKVVVEVACIVTFSAVLSGVSWLTVTLAEVMMPVCLVGFSPTAGPAHSAAAPSLAPTRP